MEAAAEYPLSISEIVADEERLSPPVWLPDFPEVDTLLQQAEVQAYEYLPWGSNYTCLTRLDGGALGPTLAVYKPQRGEAPLWDFPDGTLYQREYAAYVVSEALGWRLVPPTVMRDGPYGIGSMQLFIVAQRGTSYTTWRDERMEDLKRIALFDCLTNNADRKASHCILGRDDRIWCIDHGITFHDEPKLRTVIWEFRSQPIPELLLADLESFREKLSAGQDPLGALQELTSAREIGALQRRLDMLLEVRHFPEPGGRRSVPWPPF